MLKFERILTCALRAFPHSWRSFPHAMQATPSARKSGCAESLRRNSAFRGRRSCSPTTTAHAAAAFLTAPTRHAAILTADGVGEWATLTSGRGHRRAGRPTEISLDREIRYPHSLGLLYSTFTAFLGFSVNEDEYKVMGLAAYGRPTMTDAVRELIRRTPDGAFALVPEYFEFQTTAARSYSSQFIELFGPPRSPYEPIDLDTAAGRRYADIAASVQRVLEDTLVDLARALHRETGLPISVLAAGWR